MTLAVTLAAAALVGVTLGLLGGGGSILIVPALVYLAGVPAKPAIAMSLFVVAVTSFAGMIGHARAGRVDWRTGGLFGVAGMAGAYTGGRIAQHLPATVLLIGFGIMMAATSVAMLRRGSADARRGSADGRRGPGEIQSRSPRERHLLRILADGAIVGLVTGAVGAGGGFLVVPALVLLGGLPMPLAVGTSLLVIAMKSLAGFAGYLHGVAIDWPLTLAVTAVAVAAALAGARWSGHVDAAVLRRAFGGLVAVMAAVVLVGQLPAAARHTMLQPLAAAVAVPLIAVVAAAIWYRRSRRVH